MKSSHKKYYWGLLGLLPGFGIIAGLILMVRGSLFKDNKLIVIGCAAIISSVLIWMSFFNYLSKDKVILNEFAGYSHKNINALVEGIEFYKFKEGNYPGNLKELLLFNRNINIVDVLQTSRLEDPLYNYKNMGNKYLLFSSGIDAIPNTLDDIYPDIINNDKGAFGYIKK